MTFEKNYRAGLAVLAQAAMAKTAMGDGTQEARTREFRIAVAETAKRIGSRDAGQILLNLPISYRRWVDSGWVNLADAVRDLGT